MCSTVEVQCVHLCAWVWGWCSPKSLILVSCNFSSFPQASCESLRCSLSKFRQAYTCSWLRDLVGVSIRYCIVDYQVCFVNCGSSFLQVIDKLLADGLVAQSSLVPVYNLIHEVLWCFPRWWRCRNERNWFCGILLCVLNAQNKLRTEVSNWLIWLYSDFVTGAQILIWLNDLIINSNFYVMCVCFILIEKENINETTINIWDCSFFGKWTNKFSRGANNYSPTVTLTWEILLHWVL